MSTSRRGTGTGDRTKQRRRGRGTAATIRPLDRRAVLLLALVPAAGALGAFALICAGSTGSTPLATVPRPAEDRVPKTSGAQRGGLTRGDGSLSLEQLVSLPLSEALLRVSAEDDPAAVVEEQLSALRHVGRLLEGRLRHAKTTEERAAMLGRALRVDLGCRADLEDVEGEDLDNVLLTRVLQRRRGICLSLSLLALCVADVANLEARLVTVPRHAFLRIEADGIAANLELSIEGRAGSSPPAAYYEAMVARDGPEHDPESMRPLGRRRTLAELLRNRGNLYTQRGELERAERDLSRALALAPESFAPMVEWTLFCARVQRPSAEVRAAFERAVARHPDSAKLLYNRAVFEAGQGDSRLALHQARRALSLAPDYALAEELVKSLGDELRARGSHSGARGGSRPPLSVRYGSLSLPGTSPAVQPDGLYGLGARIHTGRPPGLSWGLHAGERCERARQDCWEIQLLEPPGDLQRRWGDQVDLVISLGGAPVARSRLDLTAAVHGPGSRVRYYAHPAAPLLQVPRRYEVEVRTLTGSPLWAHSYASDGDVRGGGEQGRSDRAERRREIRGRKAE